MVSERFIYTIEGMCPTASGADLGAWDFAVKLDRDFAKETLQTKLDEGAEKRFQEMARDILGRMGRKISGEPYIFHENTLFVSQFSLLGDGRWLNTGLSSIRDLNDENAARNFIEFHSHNTDSSADAIRLLKLFTHWTDYAQVYMDMKRER